MKRGTGSSSHIDANHNGRTTTEQERCALRARFHAPTHLKPLPPPTPPQQSAAILPTAARPQRLTDNPRQALFLTANTRHRYNPQ